MHLVLDLHGTFGERLTHWTILGGPLKPNALRFGNSALQGYHFPDAKPDGIGKFNRLNLEIDYDVLQGDLASVSHAYHGDYGSSGPSGHRQILGRRPHHIKIEIWDAGYEGPWPPLARSRVNHRKHGLSFNWPSNNVPLKLVRYRGTRIFSHQSPQWLSEFAATVLLRRNLFSP